MATAHQATGQTERIAVRRATVMDLRRYGKSTREIHAEWNALCERENHSDEKVSLSTIQNDIQVSLNSLAEQEKLGAEAARQLLIQRYDYLWSRPKFQDRLEKGELMAYGVADKLLDKYAKLYGAYAPTKVAQTDTEGKDVSNMSEEERNQRLMEWLEKAEQRKQLALEAGEDNTDEDD